MTPSNPNRILLGPPGPGVLPMPIELPADVLVIISQPHPGYPFAPWINPQFSDTELVNPTRAVIAITIISNKRKPPPEIILDIAHVEEGTWEGTTSTLANVHIPEPSNPFSDVYVLKPAF
ncbi:hypothetical protein DAPPUDRAFT_322067 [Daphnia pulex]|uniref:Uncharacterized protein n=1 Tax=Daphnia pulex TaxID=6669 RepID=E9GUH4_DAPPU|nr:hypothetical protein DAPPUDRAFT_322067 [Daphnia pulex]|eukprot:EFX76846.1 hypothetical protein DAPPUDRAFT_322067 [Daphnia pulex]